MFTHIASAGPSITWGPEVTTGQEPACQCRSHERHGFDPWVGKIPWRRAWQPTPVFLPGESHGQRCWLAYSPWCDKESDMTEVTQRAHARTHAHTHTHTLSMQCVRDWDKWENTSSQQRLPSHLQTLVSKISVQPLQIQNVLETRLFCLVWCELIWPHNLTEGTWRCL